MRILVICQYYYPENFQITPICEELAIRGHEVTVLTGLPNYPSGIVPEEYKKGHRYEMLNGVNVVRVKEIGRKHGLLFLILNYISYCLNACRKVKQFGSMFDLVFVYQLSPVMMGLPAVKYKKDHSVPMVTYVCDLWPESMKIYLRKETNPLFKIIRKVSRYVYDNSDVMLCQSNSFVDYLVDYHKESKEKIKYLPAFASDEYLNNDYYYDNGIVDFVFLGNLGNAQNLFNVLEAVNNIKEISGFHVHFVGSGSCFNEMEKYVNEKKLNKCVSFYGRRPVSEMEKFYQLADVCIVSLKADNLVGLTLPSKVQGYMAAGKPIIGMIEGSAREVIDEARCGFCVKPDDINGFSKLMVEFIEKKHDLTRMGNNGKDYFRKHFRKETFMNQLEEELMNIVNGGGIHDDADNILQWE